MNTKLLVGGIVAAVLLFFGGWLVWGILLQGFYEANMNQCMALPMEEMKWGPMIGFNVVWGFFLAIVLFWSGTEDLVGGVIKGAIIGLLVSLAFDLSFYSMTTMFTGGIKALGVDVFVNVVFTGVIGGITAFVMGKM